ncbi:MAG: thioredoxin family protein [Faecousia sp.]
MALFNFGKKKEEEKKACCCGSAEPQAEEAAGCCCGSAPKAEKTGSCCCGNTANGITTIKVLGAGCKSCHEQYENAKAAVAALGLNIEVAYVTDMEKVMEYGVMSMPAIVVNDQVVSMGKVLKAADVEKLLHKLG